ncbi:MAG: hypothetical protein LBO63_01970 [Oscillospiraceae bacterium]|nr:hypothetical protein [Oscillospiraceae bacterium]
MLVIATKRRLAALLGACAAGGYFFQGFASVGEAALSVPCRGFRRIFVGRRGGNLPPAAYD